MISKSFKELFKNPLIAIPNMIFAFILAILLSRFTDYIKDLNLSSFEPKNLLYFFFIVIAIIIASAFIMAWTYILCREIVNSEKPGILATLKESLRYYFRVLGTMFLVGLIIIGVTIAISLIIAPFIALVGISATVNFSSTSIALIVLLALILFFGVMFFAITTSPILPLLVYDNLSIGSAFSEGFRLGLKKFFPILWVMVISFFMVVPVYIIFAASSGSFFVIGFAYEAVNALVGAFIQLLFVIYIMNTYSLVKNTALESEVVEQNQNSSGLIEGTASEAEGEIITALPSQDSDGSTNNLTI